MQALAVLSDPTRQRIVEILAKGPRASGDIAREFDMTPPAISQHLKTLREAKLVRVRPDAQRRVYELNPEGVMELSEWVEGIRAFWANKLDALQNELRK